MALTSLNALVGAFASGSTYRTEWNKTVNPSAEVASTWYDMSGYPGNPPVNAMLGANTNLTHTPVSDTATASGSTAALGGSITTTTFTDTTHGTGRFTVGMIIGGAGVTPGTQITSLGTGTGANNGGTYIISPSNPTVTSQTISGSAYAMGMPHGGNVSPLQKVMSSISVFSSAATTAPSVFILYDMLAIYTISSVTTTGAQNFLNQVPWLRYASGVGVQAFLVPNIALGAGTPTVQLSYTNQNGVAGQLTPAVPTLPTLLASETIGAIPYTGIAAAGRFGPFLPLNPGDTGIKSVQSINFSATMTAGCLNLVICKPLAKISMNTIGVVAERDFLNIIPSLPPIYDGACLNWLQCAGVATPAGSNFYGHIETVWG